jgi:hypothetical protein
MNNQRTPEKKEIERMIQISEDEKLSPVKNINISPHVNSKILLSNLMESSVMEEEVKLDRIEIKEEDPNGVKKAIIKPKPKPKKNFKKIDSEEELDPELAGFVEGSGKKILKAESKRGYVEKKLQVPTVERTYPKRSKIVV